MRFLLTIVDNELEFLNRLSVEGKIAAALLTDDQPMQNNSDQIEAFAEIYIEDLSRKTGQDLSLLRLCPVKCKLLDAFRTFFGFDWARYRYFYKDKEND